MARMMRLPAVEHAVERAKTMGSRMERIAPGRDRGYRSLLHRIGTKLHKRLFGSDIRGYWRETRIDLAGAFEQQTSLRSFNSVCSSLSTTPGFIRVKCYGRARISLLLRLMGSTPNIRSRSQV